MTNDRDFVSDRDLSDSDIEAYDAGTLVPWRVDQFGVQWYIRPTLFASNKPELLAVPPSFDNEAASDDEPLCGVEKKKLIHLSGEIKVNLHGGDAHDE